MDILGYLYAGLASCYGTITEKKNLPIVIFFLVMFVRFLFFIDVVCFHFLKDYITLFSIKVDVLS